MPKDLVSTFIVRHEAVAGKPHKAGSIDEAAARIADVVRMHAAKKVALANLPSALVGNIEKQLGSGVAILKEPFADASLPETIDQVDIGITGMAFGIAQTGTLVEIALNDQVRLVSGLPRVHIGVVWAKDLVADLDDAAPCLRAIFNEHTANCSVSFISGPSRTGDIELKLTLGVHGPGEAHAIIIEEGP